MSHIFYGYNPKNLTNQEILKIKTKLNTVLKKDTPWIVITDLIDGNLKLQTAKDYISALNIYQSEKMIHDILIILRNKNALVFGMKVPDELFNKKAILDTDGECLDCSKILNDIEKSLIAFIEKNTSLGNVFILIDDIHFRTTRNKKYGLPSKLNMLTRQRNKYETIRALKKEII